MANHDSGVSRRMTIGVDTQRDTHHAAAVDDVGRVVGNAEFAVNPRGYGQLLRWARRFGEVAAVGVEGTGAYGAA